MTNPSLPVTARRLLALAERDPRRAVPLARRALERQPADRSLAHAWALYCLGWALLCWERIAEARTPLETAQTLFPANSLEELRCRHALLLVDLWQYDRPGMEAELAALAETFERAGAELEAARARLDQARQFCVLGRPRDAEAVLDRIEAPLSYQPSDRARWLRACATAANLRGEYTHTVALLEEAEQAAATHGYRVDSARCQLERAWALLLQEQIEMALNAYRRAQALYRRLDLPLRLAYCTRGLGLALMTHGLYDQALGATIDALGQFTALGRPGDIGTCLLNLGNLYFYTGQWEAAQASYLRAEELLRARGMVGDALTTQRNRAMVYRAQRRLAEAGALLTQVEAQAQALGREAEVAETWSVQAAVLADAREHGAAERRYQQARERFERLGNLPAAAECVLEQGWIALRLGAVTAALAHFQQARPALERHLNHRWRADYGLARCAELGSDSRQAGTHYRLASETVAQLRRRLASEHASSSLYAQAAQLHRDAVNHAAGAGDVAGVLALSEAQRALVLQRLRSVELSVPPSEQEQHAALHRRISDLLAQAAPGTELDQALSSYNELLLRVRHCGTGTQEPAGVVPFDLALLRAQLGALYQDDWTILSYTVSDDRLLIVVITAQGEHLALVPTDRRLQRLIAQASQPAYRPYTYRDAASQQGAAAQPWSRLRMLAESLLPNMVQERLHPAHRLLIVPAGSLHALPWTTLRLAQGWLAEHAIVQIVPSLATWQVLAAQRPSEGDAALFVGCSEFGARAPALPLVGAELEIFGRQRRDVTSLVDAKATCQGLIELSRQGRLAGYRIVHVASHAQMYPERGLAAHVKLWDGELLLSDIAGLRLGGALVVLSACEGAAADTLPGEELLSLSWALLAAGARSVIASLWPIADGASQRCIEQLYSALQETPDPAYALASAQRTLNSIYEQTGDPSAEPLWWGGLVLTGAA